MRENLAYWLLFATTVTAALTGTIMVIYKITGHSPTVEETLLVFVVAITGLLISHMNSTSKFEGKTATDVSYIKRELQELNAEVKGIRKNLSN